MHSARTCGRPALLALSCLCASLLASVAAEKTDVSEIQIEELQGSAQISPQGLATRWLNTQRGERLRAGDRLRTSTNSRVALLWSDKSVMSFGSLTEIEIRPPHASDAAPGLNLIQGILSFFHRDQPGRVRVIRKGMAAGVKGTEFVMAVDPQTDNTIISVIDGVVEVTNELGSTTLSNLQQTIVEAGRPPRPATGFIAQNVLQWCFYYPAVLDWRDLSLSADEQRALESSLTAYRAGDLVAALTNYPAGRTPGSDAERVYRAALLLAVGQAEQTETALEPLRNAGDVRIQRLVSALRLLIAAVKRDVITPLAQPELPSELLASSYYEQSRALGDESLKRALRLARTAATNSPDFSFAWVRVAELEFSFGRTSAALEALKKGLALAPRNAQALALQGFLLAAQNKVKEATNWFERALEIDSALGNAWLGRGLCRIRRGDLRGGREDLLVAAALEPQRAFLRSYLGKAYGEANEPERALHEFELAQRLDDKDPTAWLYSALVKSDQNRINEAIGDLEHSQALNDNRSVYRSSLLLDQDRAVRSANLARIYRDAGMFDWSVFEATRAVSYDYGNFSAHYFLANSYNELRDPNLINLRYETPAESEFLLANLLSPVGAGILSPAVSQQEYSKLFERNRLGVVSATEYLSRGAWTESGAQYGTFGDFSYSLEAFYHSDAGQRPNNDVEQRQLSVQAKQQLTPQDTIFVQVIQYEASGGDLTQYFDQRGANTRFAFDETQEPIVALGYHREWSPGNHTIFLAARLDDTLPLTNPNQRALWEGIRSNALLSVQDAMMSQYFRGEAEIYSTELQQIWQIEKHTTIFGGRFQWGDFTTRNFQKAIDPVFPFRDPAADQDFSVDFHRTSVYGYHYWRIVEPLQIIGGVSYDRITFPEDFRYAPISNEEETTEKVSPKAGVIWTPLRDTTARFAYTRSVSGASLDQSYQLEPAQVAGFVQSYRSIIPESSAGPNSGAKFETLGLSLEQKLPTKTYLGISGEILNSEVQRDIGTFFFDTTVLNALRRGVSSLREHLDFRERSLVASLSQLVGDEWSFGARYRVSEAQLKDVFPEIQQPLVTRQNFAPRQKTEGLLHQLDLFAIYNHPCGVFGQFDALWYHQSNERDGTSVPGDDFWQLNAFLGYRFPGRKAVLSAGVLNLTDKDYRLSPLTTYNDLPRERTAVVRLVLSF